MFAVVMSYYGGYNSSGNSDDSDDRNLEYRCEYCSNYMTKQALKRHRKIKHTEKCRFCEQKKLVDEIKQHEITHYIKCKYCGVEQAPNEVSQHEAAHLIKCKYCQANVRKEDHDKHVRENHSTLAIVGLIKSITDDDFNKWSKAGRIYAKDGCLFVQQV